MSDNGSSTETFVNNTQDRMEDLSKTVGEGANQARLKIVEQLRDVSQRIKDETQKAELDETVQTQIKSVADRMDNFAQYLEKHDVEQISAQATKVVKENAWQALLVALIIGVVIGLLFGKRD